MEWREMCTSRAEQCEEKARQAGDPQIQALYEMLAGEWRDLANAPGQNSPDKK